MTIDNPAQSKADGLALESRFKTPTASPSEHSVSNVKLAALEPGETTREIITHVANPLKWSAEKPHLYKLALELKQNGKLLERIERNVGFRKIEVRGSQFLGQRRRGQTGRGGPPRGRSAHRPGRHRCATPKRTCACSRPPI